MKILILATLMFMLTLSLFSACLPIHVESSSHWINAESPYVKDLDLESLVDSRIPTIVVFDSRDDLMKFVSGSKPSSGRTAFHSFNESLTPLSSAHTLATSMFESYSTPLYVVKALQPRFMVATFKSLDVSLMSVEATKVHMLTTLKSMAIELVGVKPSPPSRVGMVTTFRTKLLNLSSIVSCSKYRVLTTFNVLEIGFSNMSSPKIERLDVVGYGAPKYLLAGYSYSIVARVSEPVDTIKLIINSSRGVLLVVRVDVRSKSYSVGGALARCVKSVEIERGSVVVNTTLSIPWNGSLQGPISIVARALNVFGASMRVINVSALQSLSIANASYPHRVRPGQVFDVVLQFVYNGTNLIPPPGTLVRINGTEYSTDPEGRVVVELRAPTTLGRTTLTLYAVDPANSSTAVKITINVVPSQATATTTTLGTATTSTSVVQRSVGGGSLGGTAYSMLFPALLLVSIPVALVAAILIFRKREVES